MPASTDKQVDKIKKGLKESIVNRKRMLERFGFIPMSILKLARGRLSGQMYIYQYENPARHGAKDPKKKKRRTLLKDAGYSNFKTIPVSQAKSKGGGYMVSSIMPAELVDFFVKYYCKPGDTYIDPFMGQGIQLQVAHLRGLNYIGYDISREFFKYIELVAGKIDNGKTKIELHCHDARDLSAVADGVADFCFTSPPYWNIEYYGDEPEQLGNNTYPAFLADMKQVAAELHRVMKPGGVAVINTNDMRIDRRFYPYHADTITLYQEAGWEMTDMWIIDGLVGQLPKVFAVRHNMTRTAPKVHEYAMVFKK